MGAGTPSWVTVPRHLSFWLSDQLFCKCSCFTTVTLESLDDPHWKQSCNYVYNNEGPNVICSSILNIYSIYISRCFLSSDFNPGVVSALLYQLSHTGPWIETSFFSSPSFSLGFGIVKLDLKTKSQSGVVSTTSLFHILGSLSLSYFRRVIITFGLHSIRVTHSFVCLRVVWQYKPHV